MIEHLGMVAAVHDGKTTISVAIGGCRAAVRPTLATTPTHEATPPRGVLSH